MNIEQIKKIKTPKKLTPFSLQGYAYAYRNNGVDFVVMASSRQRLRKAGNLMGQMHPLNMKLVRKVILAGM